MWGSDGVSTPRVDDPLLSSLFTTAAEDPQRPLLLTESTTYTYVDVVKRATALASLLQHQGFRAGQRAVLYLDTYDGFFISLLAVWFAGGVVVPINTTLPHAEASRLVARSAPAVLLHQDRPTPPPTSVRLLRVDLSQSSSPDQTPTLTLPSPTDLAMILFTSGTTGIPKGVCQTLAAVTGNAHRVARALGLHSRDRIFINTPAYYTSGICHFLTLAAAGGSTYGQSGFFFGEALLDTLADHGCSGFGGAPAHLIRIVDPLDGPHPVPGLRFWVSSGDHLPQATIDKMRSVLPQVSLYNMYGLTEVSGRLCILAPDQLETRRGSVGRPIADMSVTARDTHGDQLAPDHIGELYVEGPLVMLGYLDDEVATQAALGPHGFRTGDFGRVDADGYVWIEGRKDDVFKRGGEKVSTVQIQQSLLELEVVADAAVLAVEDPLLGHVPVAFVVAGGGQEVRGGKLLRSLRGRLPAASLPSRIILVDAIPRTGSGKAVRAELLKLLGGSRG